MADPAGSVLLFDVDGTLAPIVDDPAAARPPATVAAQLAALAGRYRVVGAVSGRPVSFLAAHLPATMSLSGLYGLESQVDGVRSDHADADHWRPAVEAATRQARETGPAAMVVEAKGLSLTLHYRTHAALEGDVLALAGALAADLGLEVRPAKMSVELHPPIAADKGTAVRALAAGARCVLFAGDDRGDLPAFDALDHLAASGVAVLRVAVGSDEIPPEVRDRADLVLPGIDAVPALLDALLGAPPDDGSQTGP